MPSLGGLVRDVTALARAVPGVRFAERQLRGVERVALRELSARIEDAAPPPRTPTANGAHDTPAERLDQLLRRSMDQTPDESHGSLVEVVLGAIVPDEARIISALSDGSAYPLVHVNAGGVGRAPRRILSNASNIGRRAGVALPDRVPAYVTHLLSLGLIEIGPEDPSIHDEYEILLTDATVRRARDRAGDQRVRFAKHTVRISDLGKEFWRTCRP
ncbi:MAG: hypothetical protein QOD65_4120 [Gaiellales bacterium]|nr:hypothetical protein [Gaiellales bacterium]